MPKRAVEVSAPGKVNLILRILDRRPDSYHNVWSLIQAVDLADTVTIEEAPHSDIALSCEGADLPADSQNLAYRAAAAALAKMGRTGGVRLHIQKRVPVAAGMGGGSSDAAATIRGLAALFAPHWSSEDMTTIGRDIGSDVPAFFYGPTTLVEGRGERVTPLPPPTVAWIVLVNPGISIATGWAYERLAEHRMRKKQPTSSFSPLPLTSHAALSWEQLNSRAENDFGPIMEEYYPVLREIRLFLLERGAQTALLSGSGSTMFGVYGSERAAENATHRLVRPGWRVWVTRTRQFQESPRQLN